MIVWITLSDMTQSIFGNSTLDSEQSAADQSTPDSLEPATSRRRALWLTVLSVLTPGVAHWHAGRRKLATVLMCLGGVLWASIALVGLGVGNRTLLALAVRPNVLLLVIGVAVLAVPVWMWLVVSSYRSLRPRQLEPERRAWLVHVAVLALCAAVAVPPSLIANYAYAQYDLLTTVFKDDGPGSSGGGPGGEPAASAGAANTTQLPDRLNVLLLGSDAGPDRTATRTDTMMVASVDPDTGRTVLLSLPRNLQNAPMPEGPARDEYPNGFSDLLNAVYREGHEYHPEYGEDAEDPGAELLKQTSSEILGIPVHRYAKVNLAGFENLVDAIDGLDINVSEATPAGETGETFQPGQQRLDGADALWYARSRTGGSDYDRMDRQSCMMNAFANQADPMAVLNHYHEVAAATKDNLSTDIPADMLDELVGIADTIEPDVRVQFTPPLIQPSEPDFDLIRAKTHDAIERSEAGNGDSPQGNTDSEQGPGAVPTC